MALPGLPELDVENPENNFAQFEGQQPGKIITPPDGTRVVKYDFDLAQPYQQPAAPAKKQPEDGDFYRGIKISAAQITPMVKGAIGALGAAGEAAFGPGGMWSGVAEWGVRGYREGMAAIQPLARENDELTTAWSKAKGGDLGALVDWVQYGIGYGIGQMAETVGIGAAGALLGSLAAPGAGTVAGAAGGAVAKTAAKSLIRSLVEKQIERRAASWMASKGMQGAITAEARKLAVKGLAKDLGAAAALGGYNLAMGASEVIAPNVDEAMQRGEKLSGARIAQLWGLASLHAATETASDLLGINAALGRIRIPGTGRLGSAAVMGAGGAAIEGGEEVVQSGIERYAAGKPITGDEAAAEYINSFGLGAISGGPAMAISGAVHGGAQPSQPAGTPQPSPQQSIAQPAPATQAGAPVSAPPNPAIPPAGGGAAPGGQTVPPAAAGATPGLPPVAPAATGAAVSPQSIPEGEAPAAPTSEPSPETLPADAILKEIDLTRLGVQPTEQTSGTIANIIHGEPKGIPMSTIVLKMANGSKATLRAPGFLDQDLYGAQVDVGLVRKGKGPAHVITLKRSDASMQAAEQGTAPVSELPGPADQQPLTSSVSQATESQPAGDVGATPAGSFSSKGGTDTGAATLVSAGIVAESSPSPKAKPGLAGELERLRQKMEARKAVAEPPPARAAQPKELPYGQVQEAGQEAGTGQEVAAPTAAESLREELRQRFESRVDAGAHEAATSPTNDKTASKAQILGGNAELGHVRISGLDISIENPAGSERVDLHNEPPKWRTKMRAHYGYFKGVAARAPDKEHVDAYVKPGTPEDYRGPVYVIDQNKGNGQFDEPKIMVGFASQTGAVMEYLRHYEKGWSKRIRGVTKLDWDVFHGKLQDAQAFSKPQAEPSGSNPQPSGSNPQGPVAATKVAEELTNRKDAAAVVEAAGLKIKSDTTKTGRAVFNVTGDTRPHKDMLKALGGRWYGPKAAWSFDKNPVERIAERLGGKIAHNPSPQSTEPTPPPQETRPPITDTPEVTPVQRPKFGEDGYTLQYAEEDLAAMRARKKANGRIEDDRLNEQIRRQERIVQDISLGWRARFYVNTVAGGGWRVFGTKSMNPISPNYSSRKEAESAAAQFFDGGVMPDPQTKMEASPTEDDLAAQFDSILADMKAEEAQKKPAPASDVTPAAKIRRELAARKRSSETGGSAKPRSTQRTAGEAAASAAKNTAAGFQNAIAGLGELFGSKGGKLSMGVTFDEETYAKAKPLFAAAAANFRQAGADLGDVMKAVMVAVRDQFGLDVLERMKPYVVRYVKDVRAETAYSEGKENGDVRGTEGQGSGALGDVSPEPVGATESGGSARPGAERGSTQGGQADQGDDGSRDKTGRGRGDRPAADDLPAAGDGRTQPSDAGGTGREGSRVPQDLRGADGGVIPAAVPQTDYEIGDDVGLGSGGQMTKYRDNVAAIRVLKQIEAERRRPTPEEKRTLARYVGWGGIPNAFRNAITKEVKADWAAEVAELESLLTAQELRAASASTPNAHYTSKPVVNFMWALAERLGFSGGMVLEPSVGTGNFIGLMPKGLRAATHVTGVELDSLTARIAGALYGKANIVHSGFERLPMPDDHFDLAIGNPPFGKTILRFPYKPELAGSTIHNQFFRASIDAVRPGGLQIMVVSRYLMDAQSNADRLDLAKKARLIGAIRLPGMAFKGNALTEVVTDVIVLQRRTAAEEADIEAAIQERGKKPQKGESFQDSMARQRRSAKLADEMAWTETRTVPDPLGGEPMVVSRYFAENPEMVLGTMDRSGSMRENDINVTLPKGKSIEAVLTEALERFRERVSEDIEPGIVARNAERHRLLGEALKLHASGAEIGAIRFDDAGDLRQVVERIGEDGSTFITTIQLTENTPWSDSLAIGLDGKWFEVVPKVGDDGKPVKVMKDGKPTKLNQYERKVYKNEADIPPRRRLGATKLEKMKKLIAIRDLLAQQLALETGGSPAEQMEANRTELRRAYEAFVSKYGFISEPKNASDVSDMPDEGLLLSLETNFKREVTAAKSKATGMKVSPARADQAAILTKPVGVPPVRVDHADTPEDALALSLSETGRLDLDLIERLRGISREEVEKELTGGETPLAYFDPEQNMALVDKNEYLSGNVRKKLAAARGAGLSVNVSALEKVQPALWTSDQVTPKLGAAWIPAETYQQFSDHLLGGDTRVTFAKLTNTFQVFADDRSAAATAKWGTKDYPAPQLLTTLMNSRKVAVYDPLPDGGRAFNQEKTDAALDKRREILEEFDSWVFKDSTRRKLLTELFNDRYNTRVARQHDGSHMKFPGKVPYVKLRRGQVNAIWRGVVENYVLYDHAVGAGKTFIGVARAMERRRMGLSKKPMIVVPNHLVKEWQVQTLRLYPGAKVLAAGKADMEAKNRRRLFAKIATGDWDLVIVPHSSFQFISVSPETEERFLNSQLELANEALKEADEQAEGAHFKTLGQKQAEALIKKLEDRIEKVRERKRDKLVTFEQMGIDDLTVDEAHEFKNLQYSTSLTDVRGMGNPSGSGKALDLFVKTKLLHENGSSVAFLTGTPISNSAAEMYTILRYLAPHMLEEMGMSHFDAFRLAFVDATTKFEPTDSGSGLKAVTRLGRQWSNMRALMDAYYSVADVVTNEDIKAWFAEDNPGKEFPLPKVKGGGRQAVAVEPTPTQRALLDNIIAQFDSLQNIEDIKQRNAQRLRLMDQARKVSLHAKAVNPAVADEPGGKLDRAVVEIKRLYDKFNTVNGTQLVFLDRGVPKAKGDDKLIAEYDDARKALDAAMAADDADAISRANDHLEKFDRNEIEELRSAQTSGWSGYQHIKDGLTRAGIPEGEIAFIQNYTSDADKKALFDAVNDGTIRVLLGSTPRMGAGTNVQERLVGLHHIDATWKPSDIEQREGRIIRQGNRLAFDEDGNAIPGFEVEILAYVTKNTVDAKLWDLNSTKLRMVNAIRYYDGSFEMDFEDEDAVGMAEIAAIASGDPLLLERFRLTGEVDQLYRQQRSFNRRIDAAQDSLEVARSAIEHNPKQIANIEETEKFVEARLAAIRPKVEARRASFPTGEAGTLRNYGQSGVSEARQALWNEWKRQRGDDNKGPFRIEINGNPYTSYDATENALSDLLGDESLFSAELGGKETGRRVDVARAMKEVIGEEFKEVPSPVKLGTMYGLPIEVETHWHFGYPYVTLSFIERLPSGRVISVHNEISPDKWKKGSPVPVSSSALRGIVSRLSDAFTGLANQSSRKRELADQMEKAKVDVPNLEEAIREKFKHSDELQEKTARLREVETELAARAAAAAAAKAKQDSTQAVGNTAKAPKPASPHDMALWQLASNGGTATDILAKIAKDSPIAFNRRLATLLRGLGVNPSIAVGTDESELDIENADEYRGKFVAAYSSATDTIHLLKAGDIEADLLHEFVHAATLRAIAFKTPAAAEMDALFEHVKTKAWFGAYGLKNVKEFVAEAFTNPEFQSQLRAIPAPSNKSKFRTMIDWLWDIVRRIVGLSVEDRSALAKALEIGERLMEEDARLQGRVEDISVGSIGRQPQTAEESFLSKIGAGPETIAERARHLHGNMQHAGWRAVLGDALISLRQKTVDQFEALRHLDRLVLGEDFEGRIANPTDRSIAAETSAWVMARMSRSAEGPLEAWAIDGELRVKHGAITVDTSGEGLLPLLASLPKGEGDRFLAWVAANRSSDIMGRAARADRDLKIVKAEMLNTTLAKRVAKTANDLAAYKVLERRHAELKRMADFLSERAAVRERLFTADEVAAGLALNQGDMADGKPRGRAYADVFRRFRALQKSVLDIAEEKGLINADDRAVWESEFYVPFYRYLEDTQDVRGPGRVAGLVRQRAFERLRGGTDKLGDLLHNTLLNTHHLIAASMANEAARIALERAAAVGSALPVTGTGKNVVWVMHEGRKAYFEVLDPRLLESISAITAPSANPLAIKVLGAFKNALTRGVTLDPSFRIRNLIRDSISAIGMSSVDVNPLKNIVEGWKATAESSKSYQQMRAGGGAFHFGQVLGDDAQKARKLIERDQANVLATPRQAWGFMRRVFDAYEDLGSRLENVNRAALFEQIMAGKDDLLAANFASRDLLDFSQRGAAGAVRFLTQVVPFLNARIQGLDKLARTAMDKRQRTRLLYTLGAVTAASVLLYLAYKDDPDFKQREDWDRETYWWWKIGGQAFRLPKPFEIGAIGTIGERMVELMADDEATGQHFAARSFALLRDQFQFNPIPQMLVPGLELVSNKDWFTGRPIEAGYMENLAPTERIGPRTSSVAIAGSKVVAGAFSPVQIDHLVRGYFGWLGATVTDVVDYGLELTGARAHRAQTGPRGVPIVAGVAGSFVPNMDRLQSKYVSLWYDQQRQIRQAYSSYRNLIAIGDRAGAEKWLTENAPLITMRQFAGRVEKQEGRIASRMRQVERDPTLPAAEKTAEVDRLNKLKNEIAQLAVRRAQARLREKPAQ